MHLIYFLSPHIPSPALVLHEIGMPGSRSLNLTPQRSFYVCHSLREKMKHFWAFLRLSHHHAFQTCRVSFLRCDFEVAVDDAGAR